MYFIYTAFDKSKLTKPKPLGTIVYDSETNDSYSVPMFVKGNSEAAIFTRDKARYLKEIITTQPVVLNDFKSHILALELLTGIDYNVHEMIVDDQLCPREWTSLKPFMHERFDEIKAGFDSNNKWQPLMARATLVYCDLEKRGVLHEGGIVPVCPSYQYITTGRASTSGFNIQGMQDGIGISSVHPDQDVFVCADWLSADLRAAAVLSNDKKLLQSFDNSDPYTELAQATNMTRDECKSKTLPGLYSLNLNSDIFKHYNTFRGWAEASIAKMDKEGHLTSILGRKFNIKGQTEQQLLDSRRQVFNAQMQGTVAHAMHNVLVQVHRKYPHNILTELHDSLILCCNRNMVKSLIDDVTNIMLRPFKGILDNDPTFPLRVYIGNRWRPSKLYKVYRTCNG